MRRDPAGVSAAFWRAHAGAWPVGKMKFGFALSGEDRSVTHSLPSPTLLPMNPNPSLRVRPLARALCALALAGSFVLPSSAQPGQPGGAPGQLPGGGGPAFPGGGQRGGARGGQAAQPPGPPAPVPAAVAMARPTEAELAQLNAAVKQFVATNPIAAKYQSLITVTPPRAVNPAASFSRSGVRNDTRHNAFVETAKAGDIDVLFHGDSITDWWQQTGAQGGKEVFEQHFAGMKVANFAIAGDTTQGLLWGLQNGEGRNGNEPVKMQPKAIMLMIGTNNTGGSTGPEIAEGVGAVVAELQKDFPSAKILLLAIFPRGAGPTDANRLKNDEANKIIAKLHNGRNVVYLDIGDKFLDPATKAFLPGLFRNDNLHPAAPGYEVWANAVKDKLAELIK
jgi:lysophospholipase L1-like esterase